MELSKWGHLEMKIAVNASTHLWNTLNVCGGGGEATLALFNSSNVTIPTPQHIIKEHRHPNPRLPGCHTGEALGTLLPLENYA